MGDSYFKFHHRRYRPFFTKSTFSKFYNALKHEIRPATRFRLSDDLTKRIITLFKTQANEDEFWEVFDSAMQELYEFDMEHYVSMCRYLFKEHSHLSDDDYVVLEFYALSEAFLQELQNIEDETERRLKYFLDDRCTQADHFVSEYFNATKQDAQRALTYLLNCEVDAFLLDAAYVCMQQGDFKHAFLHLLRALLQVGVVAYKQNGRILFSRMKIKINGGVSNG